MRFLSIALFTTLAVGIFARDDSCDPGRGLTARGNCEKCPADTFGTGGTAACKSCPAGSSSGERASYCTCDAGYTSSTGTATNDACSACPAGYRSINQRKSCQPCDANTYASGDSCPSCKTGYTSAAKSTECTPVCPAGTIYKSYGPLTRCDRCPANKYSNAGDSECTSCPGGWTSEAGSGACKPQPSKRAQPVLSSSMCVGEGMERCEVWSGMGGSECINVLTTLDSCGGCVGPEGDDSSTYTGRDCSTIPHVGDVSCEQGTCLVKSCRNGYKPSGSECVEQPGRGHTRSMRRHDAF